MIEMGLLQAVDRKLRAQGWDGRCAGAFILAVQQALLGSSAAPLTHEDRTQVYRFLHPRRVGPPEPAARGLDGLPTRGWVSPKAAPRPTPATPSLRMMQSH
jgi:hypothetical protein